MTDDFNNKLQAKTIVLIADIPNYDVILGLPWMDTHFKSIDFGGKRAIEFKSSSSSFKTSVCGIQAALNDYKHLETVPAVVESTGADPARENIVRSCGMKPDSTIDCARDFTANDLSSTTKDVTVARDAGSSTGSSTLGKLRMHHINVLSAQVGRWSLCGTKHPPRKPALTIPLMSIRGLRKASKSKGTVMFLATNVF